MSSGLLGAIDREHLAGVVLGIVVGACILFGGLYATQSLAASPADGYAFGIVATYAVWKSPDVFRFVRARGGEHR